LRGQEGSKRERRRREEERRETQILK